MLGTAHAREFFILRMRNSRQIRPAPRATMEFLATLSWLLSDLLPNVAETLLNSVTLFFSLVSLATQTVLDFCAGVVELSTSLYLRTLELVAVLTSYGTRISIFVSSTATTAWSWVLGTLSTVSSALLTVYAVVYDTLSILLPSLALGLEGIVRGAALLLRGGLTLFHTALDFVTFFSRSFLSLVSTILNCLSALLSVFYSSGKEKQKTEYSEFTPHSSPVVTLLSSHFAVLVATSVLVLALLLTLCGLKHRDLVPRAWGLVKDLVTRGLQLLVRDIVERRPHQQQQGGDGVDFGQRGAAGRGEQDRNGDGGLQLGLDQQQSGGGASPNLHRRSILLSPNVTDHSRQIDRQTLGQPQSLELTPNSPHREGPPSSPPLSSREREGEQSRLCIVCMDKEKKVLLRPCRHYCVCEGCSLRLRGECPVCREAIQSSEVIHVYYD